MKKILLFAILMVGMFSVNLYSQNVTGLIDEQNVTVTMDLQPVLQLNMNTPDQINFTFNQIPEYIGGEIQYAATILTVSSSVSWDLWAVGTSQGSLGVNKWDLQMQYNGTPTGLATNVLPLSALELHQSIANPYLLGADAGDDYNAAFVPVPSPQSDQIGTNSVYESTAAPYAEPAQGNRYIMGDAGVITGGLGGCPGGSYLSTGAGSIYYISIDYRIVPGMPAVFPFATTDAAFANESLDNPTLGTFAQPGVYTMDVKYILAQDQ